MPLFVWAMGSCMQLQRVLLQETLGAIRSQGDIPYSSPNLSNKVSHILQREGTFYEEIHNQINIEVAFPKDGNYAFTHKMMSREQVSSL